MKRQTQSEGNGIVLTGTVTSSEPLTVNGSKISWTSVSQRGTVIYTNQRTLYVQPAEEQAAL